MTRSVSEHDDDEIRLRLEVDVPCEAAFDAFVEDFSKWYPPEYSWSGLDLEWIGLQAWPGGRCFERGPQGFQCDWGRVLSLDRPHRLRLTWQIGFDRVPVPNSDSASEIEVEWASGENGSCLVSFSHREFRRHGRDWKGYRDAMATEHGWPYVLGRYSDYLTRR